MNIQKFSAVVKYEYKKVVFRWAFLIGTLLFPLLAGGFAVVPALIFSIKGEPTRIAVVDQTGKIAPRLKENLTAEKMREKAQQAAKEQLQAGVVRLQVLEKAAPGDLRDPVGTLVDVASKIEAALDPQAREHPPLNVDEPALQKASSKVVDYSASKCGVDLTVATTPDPTTTTPTPASTSS